MHDIKIIRDDSKFFIKKLSERNVTVDVKKLLDLDEKNRDLIFKKEKLEQEKKTISQKKDLAQFKKSKEISFEIDSLNEKQTNHNIIHSSSNNMIINKRGANIIRFYYQNTILRAT